MQNYQIQELIKYKIYKMKLLNKKKLYNKEQKKQKNKKKKIKH